jgi:hypothetical protein
LQGAILDGAQLQGANLSDTRFEGADLRGARLEGTDLRVAWLRGADLTDAWLQGADLSGAQLQGANLSGARLQGAFLFSTQLQGASLSGAEMAAVQFDGTSVFRTDIANATLSESAIRSVRADAATFEIPWSLAPLTPADVDKWIVAATEFAAETEKTQIIKRFGRLHPDSQTADQDAADQAKWGELAKLSLALDPDGAQYRRRLATILGDLVCEADGAPYVARALITGHETHGPPERNTLSSSLGGQLDFVRNRMKEGRATPKKCSGVADFTEDDWRNLDAIKAVQEQNISQPATPEP